jgi:hypothetical protein
MISISEEWESALLIFSEGILFYGSVDKMNLQWKVIQSVIALVCYWLDFGSDFQPF